MAENSWLMIPADNNIIFEMSHAEKWQGAAHAMGIEVWQLSPEAGHA